MERCTLKTALCSEIELILGVRPGVDDDLFEAGLDSFGLLQLVGFLEDELGAPVPEERIGEEHFRTVGTIAAWVRASVVDHGPI
jgi:acyl carrier protein